MEHSKSSVQSYLLTIVHKANCKCHKTLYPRTYINRRVEGLIRTHMSELLDLTPSKLLKKYIKSLAKEFLYTRIEGHLKDKAWEALLKYLVSDQSDVNEEINSRLAKIGGNFSFGSW